MFRRNLLGAAPILGRNSQQLVFVVRLLLRVSKLTFHAFQTLRCRLFSQSATKSKDKVATRSFVFDHASVDL